MLIEDYELKCLLLTSPYVSVEFRIYVSSLGIGLGGSLTRDLGLALALSTWF